MPVSKRQLAASCRQLVSNCNQLTILYCQLTLWQKQLTMPYRQRLWRRKQLTRLRVQLIGWLERDHAGRMRSVLPEIVYPAASFLRLIPAILLNRRVRFCSPISGFGFCFRESQSVPCPQHCKRKPGDLQTAARAWLEKCTAGASRRDAHPSGCLASCRKH